MPGKSIHKDVYRYGFNGMEKDDEIAGAGVNYTAEYWQYDARLGRRWNIDPVFFPSESPYSTFSNNPIFYNDPNGDCASCKPEEEGKSEGESSTVEWEKKVSDPLNPGMSTTHKFSKTWYWHGGSLSTKVDDDGNEITTGNEKGWYSVSDYKEILTGTSSDAVNVLPMMLRSLMQDVVGRKSEITEKELSVKELLALRQVVLKAMHKGKIEYADYATTESEDPYSDVAGNSSGKGYGAGYSVMGKFSNPYYALKTTLGQAKIVVEGGEVYVVDTYDFNDAAQAQNGTKIQVMKSFWEGVGKANESESSGKKIYSHARNIGTHFGSKDGEGIPVKIKIPFIKP